MFTNCPIERRFARHLVRRADSRARLSVGSRMLTSSAMMPITTSSSTSVKPRRRVRAEDVGSDIIPSSQQKKGRVLPARPSMIDDLDHLLDLRRVVEAGPVQVHVVLPDR